MSSGLARSSRARGESTSPTRDPHHRHRHRVGARAVWLRSYVGASRRLEGLAWAARIFPRSRRRNQPLPTAPTPALCAGATLTLSARSPPGRPIDAVMTNFAISTDCASKRSPPPRRLRSQRWRSTCAGRRDQSVFSPSPSAAHARAIVALRRRAGAGVVALGGEMLDRRISSGRRGC